MSILAAIGRYLAVMGLTAGAGLVVTKLFMSWAGANGAQISAPSNYGNYLGLWIVASLVVSMVLAGVSFFFSGVANADAVSHYEGTAIGNAVDLHPVTEGEISWKWRVGLLWALMFAAEFFLLP